MTHIHSPVQVQCSKVSCSFYDLINILVWRVFRVTRGCVVPGKVVPRLISPSLSRRHNPRPSLSSFVITTISFIKIVLVVIIIIILIVIVRNIYSPSDCCVMTVLKPVTQKMTFLLHDYQQQQQCFAVQVT